ncbi:MAG: ATP phosphoribosyltransferase regulatory subunit [Nitratireductor sp.]
MIPAFLFAERGCELPQIGLLQPADPFLDTAGEDLRRRIFITADQTGANLCLRPEFTIPVCLHHLESGRQVSRYGYAGTRFRQRQDEPHEFRQAGIEDLGNDNRIVADIAAISDCLDAMAETGLSGLTLVLGDQSVFEAMLKGLNLPLAWQKRLGRAFGDTARLKADVARLAGEGVGETSNLPAELEAAVLAGNAMEVGQWVADRMRRFRHFRFRRPQPR